MMQDFIYGIDFGTSNSGIAVMKDGSGMVIQGNSKSDKTLSSVLFFPKPSSGLFYVYVGEEAIQKYIETGMEGRLIQSIKTVLPDKSFDYTIIHGETYRIEDLIKIIIADLKEKADYTLQKNVTKAVLGRPVFFSDDDPEANELAAQRLLTAAYDAGFEDVYLQLEPIAAAFAYEQTITNPELVLVADFGAGTSDFTLMRLDPKKSHLVNRRSDILATGGVHIGGDDFDSEIMWHKLASYFGYGAKFNDGDKWLEIPVHILRKLCRWEKMSFLKSDHRTRRDLTFFARTTDSPESLLRLITLIDYDLGFSLFQSIEHAKKDLSQQQQSYIAFERMNIRLQELITLTELDQMIAEKVEQLKTYITSFLADANVKEEKIDIVFMTGGSSLVKKIRKIFIDMFGQEKIRGGETFTSVAKGLALSSSLFF